MKLKLIYSKKFFFSFGNDSREQSNVLENLKVIVVKLLCNKIK